MRTIIIGGGLAGLYAAYRLQQNGRDYVLVEASDHFGGRATGWQIDEHHQLELGATWYWPDFQPDIASLIEELGLNHFAQPAGYTIYDSGPGNVHILNRPYSNGQRVQGGMTQLIDALVKKLDKNKLMLGQKVTRVTLKGKVLVETIDQQFVADRVLLALPPRLAAGTIEFSPALPEATNIDWLTQETWMAPHAKLVYHFSRPFWLDRGLTGDAISEQGVMFEVHSISQPDAGFGALFGFVRLDAKERQALGEDALLEAGLLQLSSYYGPAVQEYLIDTFYKDWSLDDLVATEADWEAKGHQFKTAQSRVTGPWQYQLIGIASEFSNSFPGYLAGAIEAVEDALHS